jgi:hypothetical protein
LPDILLKNADRTGEKVRKREEEVEMDLDTAVANSSGATA